MRLVCDTTTPIHLLELSQKCQLLTWVSRTKLLTKLLTKPN